MPMNAQQWNEKHPVGTPVVAYPGCRPEDDPNDERLVTRTRSRASVLGGHTDVVWVDGHSACIALTHVDPEPTVTNRPKRPAGAYTGAPCRFCRAPKPSHMYLCGNCWALLPAPARHALSRRDSKAVARLRALHDQLDGGRLLNEIEVTP